jgi:hypothetical protein
LAAAYVNDFASRYDEGSPLIVNHDDLYNFLYEREFPNWFIYDSQRYTDGRSLELSIMKLKTGETLRDLFFDLTDAESSELGEAYSHKPSETMLVHYAEGLSGSPESAKPTEHAIPVAYLKGRLELDGLLMQNSRLLTTDMNVLADEEEENLVKSLCQDNGPGNS